MAYNADWLPGKRSEQIAMAQNWLSLLSKSPLSWGVPESEVAMLRHLERIAEDLLSNTTSSHQTETITAQCRAAFGALVAKMRFIKSRYFLNPPLTDADFISLMLKPKSLSHTPIPPPTALAEADILRPSQHQLILCLRSVPNSLPNPHMSDYGFRIYWGIMPYGGATVENAIGAKRELVKTPISGEELPHSKFTRRKKERFDFPQEDCGKTVYFCIRYENTKGQPGPWGPIFSAIIP
jgi:hypothetical protein